MSVLIPAKLSPGKAFRGLLQSCQALFLSGNKWHLKVIVIFLQFHIQTNTESQATNPNLECNSIRVFTGREVLMSALIHGPQPPATTPLSIFRPDPSYDEPGHDVTSPIGTATLPQIFPMTGLATPDTATQDTSALLDGLSTITEGMVPAVLAPTAPPAVKTASPLRMPSRDDYFEQEIREARFFLKDYYGLEIPSRKDESLADQCNRLHAMEDTLRLVHEQATKQCDWTHYDERIVQMSWDALKTLRLSLRSRQPNLDTHRHLSKKYKLAVEIPTDPDESLLDEFFRLVVISEALARVFEAHTNDCGEGRHGAICKSSFDQLTIYLRDFNLYL